MIVLYDDYSVTGDFYEWSASYISKLREEGVVKYVTSYEEFKKILDSARLVIAVFTTPTCTACMIYKPIFYMVADKMKDDDVKFIEVDAFYAPEAAYESNVLTTPTTVAYIDGSSIEMVEGILDEESLIEFIKNIMSKTRG